MKVHDLKCIPPYFDDILAGRKPFDSSLPGWKAAATEEVRLECAGGEG